MSKNSDYKNEFGWFAERPQVPRKLYDSKYVLAGLVVFVLVITLPLWPNLGKSVPAPKPDLNTPAIMKLPEKERKCVMDLEFMRANHMQLLNDWRDEVVRNGNREFTGAGGKKYLASLQNTCMECHSNKTKFCDQCHNYAAVVPNCWGCHLDREKKQVARAEAK